MLVKFWGHDPDSREFGHVPEFCQFGARHQIYVLKSEKGDKKFLSLVREGIVLFRASF
jgi:hypothetical protein